MKLTRRIALLQHLLECQITGPGRSSGQEGAVAAPGSAAGTLQGPDQERCRGRIRSVAAYRSVAAPWNVARPNMTKWSPSRSIWQNPSKIDQTYRAPGAPAGMPNYWPGQQQWPGSSSCSVRQCCRNVAGMLQGQEQERCSVQERCSAQECCRGRNDQMVTKQVNLAES